MVVVVKQIVHGMKLLKMTWSYLLKLTSWKFCPSQKLLVKMSLYCWNLHLSTMACKIFQVQNTLWPSKSRNAHISFVILFDNEESDSLSVFNMLCRKVYHRSLIFFDGDHFSIMLRKFLSVPFPSPDQLESSLILDSRPIQKKILDITIGSVLLAMNIRAGTWVHFKLWAWEEFVSIVLNCWLIIEVYN